MRPIILILVFALTACSDAPRNVSAKGDAIIWVHGGGFTKGSPAAQNLMGLESALPDIDHYRPTYTLSTESVSGYQLNIREISAEVEYRRSQARHVILAGTSAGATIAFHAAVLGDHEPDGLILFYGLYDFSRPQDFNFPDDDERISQYFGQYDSLLNSPVNQARSLHIPVLLVHGIDDETVSAEQTRILAGLLPSKSVYPVAGHSFPVVDEADIIRTWMRETFDER